jgi:hypothetical protein
VVFLRAELRYGLFMESPLYRNNLPFDRPAHYQISVQGRIDPTWSDRLEGMVIYLPPEEVDPQITTLEGELSDQAALAGVLSTLYELHLTLLLVARQESELKQKGDESCQDEA